MMKKIRKSISSLTLRALCKNKSHGAISLYKEGWFFQKRQESTLIQSDPSIDDGFNVAAFYVEGQLDFPNQVPENVLQLYHELYDMEQKVKSLENEIAVYVMSFQRQNRPPKMRKLESRRLDNFSRKCCIPSILNCTRPAPVISETYARSATNSRPVKNTNKTNAVSTAVQTTEVDDRRMSKVSWNSKVDVRYIGSNNVQGKKGQKVSSQGPEQQLKVNKDIKNVVHLKIKIPKDVLNLTNDDGGQEPKRLENEWKSTNSLGNMDEQKSNATAKRSKANTNQSVAAEHGPSMEIQTFAHSSCPDSYSQKDSSFPKTSFCSRDDYMKPREIRGNEPPAGDIVIPGARIVQSGLIKHSGMVGNPIKQPSKAKCESQDGSFLGSALTEEDRLENVRKSLEITESELLLLEKTVRSPPGPIQLKITTEYGSVNVISHGYDCKCEICETFGSQDNSRQRRSGRSDSAAVISKKIIRVHYNGDYRNIITHTEECGCDICTNIEEHSNKLVDRKTSIPNTNQHDLAVGSRGVCGCKNCKTVEMSPHIVETMLSRTSSHAFDRCYYSDATIPSMQSFPREILTTTDDQGTSFSSPPSINSSDISDNYDPSPMDSNAETSTPGTIELHNHLDPCDSEVEPHLTDPVTGSSKQNNRCEHGSDLWLSRKTRRIREFVKPSSAKSSPAGLNKQGKHNKFPYCSTCKHSQGNNIPDTGKAIPMKSRFSTSTNMTPSIQQPQRVPNEDNGGNGQSTNDKLSQTVDLNADKKLSSYNADHVTLEDLIRDLIGGQPRIQKDKVYKVTLGEVANKAYTKIQIVDCSSESAGMHENEPISNGPTKGKVQMQNGDGANSNVFFIKPLQKNIGVSQISCADFSNFIDTRSMSSPVCVGNSIELNAATHDDASLQENRVTVDTAEGHQESKMVRSASDASPRVFKLTIRFGKKVVSFFRQRRKKNTMSKNNTSLAEREHEVKHQDNLKCRKTFTIYDGTGEHFKPVELLKIDGKPRYFAIESNSTGTEADSLFKHSQLLCLVEKNRNIKSQLHE